MVSGAISLPSRGAFHLSFTVLYAIGHWVVFRLGGWSPQLPTGFLVSGGTPDPAAVSSISLTGFSPSVTGLPMPFGYRLDWLMLSSTPEVFLPPVWPPPRSLATTCGISFDFFSSPYLDVSVQAVPPVYLFIQYTVTEYCSAGFPHSDIHGSMPAFGSPWLFADRCVLLRLPVPRHPPCALRSLTMSCKLYGSRVSLYGSMISHQATLSE
jgi:hypothetical protein